MRKGFTILQKGVIMNKNIFIRVGLVFDMIKRVLTLKVVFNNILSAKKYKKETKIPKKNICILGISKL